MILATMALRRRDEADDSGPRRVQIVKAVLRPLRAVFQGSKQRLRVGIVIAHSRTATRSRDAQIVHFAQQRLRLHRRAVVRVQHQWLMQALLADDSAFQQLCGQFAAFLPVDPFKCLFVPQLFEPRIDVVNTQE